MPITQDVFKVHRIVPIRARRAVDGEPDNDHPDLDDRGFADPEFGPVVSLTQGRTVIVRLTRNKLDAAAPLTVVSSDTSIFTIADPASGTLPTTNDMDVKITGVDGGGDSRDAKLQVKFAGPDGPVVIFEMRVVVFRELEVDVTPHRITVNSATATGTAPVADIPKIMDKVQAIWGHYGIRITPQPIRDKTVQFATVNGVSSAPFDGTGEVSKLLDTDHVPRTINAYFVPQILSSDPSFITLGLGISRATATSTGIAKPGIILADGPASLARAYVMFWANDLAHEIGHFFTLEHVENAQRPNELEDSWSRRMLMHVFNEMRTPNPFPTGGFKFRPRFVEAGYGLGQNTGRRGCMVTLKDLKLRNFDGEVATARKTIKSAAGPF
jgi:hypothetical protein